MSHFTHLPLKHNLIGKKPGFRLASLQHRFRFPLLARFWCSLKLHSSRICFLGSPRGDDDDSDDDLNFTGKSRSPLRRNRSVKIRTGEKLSSAVLVCFKKKISIIEAEKKFKFSPIAALGKPKFSTQNLNYVLPHEDVVGVEKHSPRNIFAV